MSCTGFLDSTHPLARELNLTGTDIDRFNACADAATDYAKKFTGRELLAAELDETHQTNQFGSVYLRGFPVLRINRIYSSRAAAVSIQHSTASVATASLTALGTLRLLSVTNGTQSTVEISLASNATLAALETAVELNSGWNVTINGGLGAMPSADLATGQFVACAGSDASLYLWLDHESQVDTDPRLGTLRGFGSNQKIRVSYRGGYDPLPTDLEWAVYSIAKELFGSQSARLISESLGGYSYSLASAAVARVPDSARILDSYKDLRV